MLAAGCEIGFAVHEPCLGGPRCQPDASADLWDAAVPADAATAPADAALGLPDASAALPDASVAGPDSSIVLPDAGVLTPDAALALPDAAIVLPDAAASPPDASIDPPDAAADLPDAASATCTDGQKNGAETDVDCGGPCGPCADCRRCRAASDCAGGACTTGLCGAAGAIRVRATYWTINDVWLRHVNVVLDCQNALNRQCTISSGCSTALASDCGGTCVDGQQCWIDTTYGSPQGQQTIDLTAALACPHTVCLYPGSYPSYEWGGTLEVFQSGWTQLATTTSLTGWSWLCAAGVLAR
ncbi:MAG TPA: hypothetical protein VGK67_21505 [Myxococcales bacterium]|jgi:hypothetical protein